MKKLSYTYRVGGKKTQGLVVVVVVFGLVLAVMYKTWIKLGVFEISLLVGILMLGVLMYLFVDAKTHDMLDEVYEDGETLLLKRSGKECRVPLTDIKNISYSDWRFPEITLYLRHSTEWGDHLRYYAGTSSRWAFWRYKRETNQATKDLIERIDRMRNVAPDVVGDAASEITSTHEKVGKRISSGWMCFKYIVISCLTINLVVSGLQTVLGQNNSRLDKIMWMPKFLFIFSVVGGIACMMTAALFFWRAIEKVFDGGDHLLLKKSGREERIPLRNIKNVSYSNVLFPFRVTLDLRHPCQWGDRVVFLPPSLLFSEKRNGEMIDDLIDRIDRARIAASSNPSSVAMAQPSGHWKSKEDGQMEQGAGSQAME